MAGMSVRFAQSRAASTGAHRLTHAELFLDMTEAEILAMRIGLTGLIISVVSVSFGMISAYIAGLWLFLQRAPLSLRTLAFLLLSIGLFFMGYLTWGLHRLMLGTDRAWSKLASNSMGIESFGGERPDYLFGLTLYQAGALVGFLAFFAIYLALGYLTFLYRWHGGSEANV
jgi:hypothetical protein